MPKEMLGVQLSNQMIVEATVQDWISAMLLAMTDEQRAIIINNIERLKQNRALPIVGRNNTRIG